MTWGAGTKWEGQYIGDLSSKYIQVGDINLGSYSNWTPIGVDIDNSFTGIYNGGNYTISNLKINNITSKFDYIEFAHP